MSGRRRFDALARLFAGLFVLYVCMDAAGPDGQLQLNIGFPASRLMTLDIRDAKGRTAPQVTLTLDTATPGASGARYVEKGVPAASGKTPQPGEQGVVFWAKADKAILELPPGHPLADAPSGRPIACQMIR